MERAGTMIMRVESIKLCKGMMKTAPGCREWSVEGGMPDEL